ncbi:MAG TPA: DNA replication/repair protein RecF [Fulvivirga sp.]|nr:DNA replication/repair protein RecF [Fulvivirga sp.]
MHIENLSLINFKNYTDVSLIFSSKINCLVGLNGSGKTNILDAIYYLSMTKSAHNPMDNQNIKFGEKYFSIKGTFELPSGINEAVCYFEEGAKKSFKVNKKDYGKLSEHIGRFPVVLITPYDTDIIREGSEVRRKFFDAIICQLDTNYLGYLIQYNNNLKQRNSSLKQFNKSGIINKDLLENYNNVLVTLSEKIYKIRKRFLETFDKSFQGKYNFIGDPLENVSIDYYSQLESNDFKLELEQATRKDVAMERTTMGIHRDDFKFKIDNNPLKKYGSQGQQKSFSIALKLAHFDVILNELNITPILLLDDIFDKLDTKRIKKLLQLILGDTFGQVFITDAREERTRDIMGEFNIDATYFTINNGKVLEEA